MRYLSAILNSSTIKYWLRYRGSMQGLNFQIDAAPLQQIPIAKAARKHQEIVATLVRLVQMTYVLESLQPSSAAFFLEDLIDACVMECYFRTHMFERDLLFLDDLSAQLIACDFSASETEQRDFLARLHGSLNAPSSTIRNRLLRLTADSPDLLAVIKEEGKG